MTALEAAKEERARCLRIMWRCAEQYTTPEGAARAAANAIERGDQR